MTDEGETWEEMTAENERETFDFYGFELPLWVAGAAAVGQWFCVLLVIIGLFWSGMQAKDASDRWDRLYQEMQEQGCIAIHESPAVNISGAGLGLEINGTANTEVNTSATGTRGEPVCRDPYDTENAMCPVSGNTTG